MTPTNPPKHLVLYADDDDDDLLLVRDAFNRYATNVELMTFPDGISLLEHLKKRNPEEPHPCLVILDINMPILNGKETLKELRKLEGFEDVPAVIFSTSSLPFDRNYAKKMNAGFITKPLNTEQLASVAEEFVSYCDEDIRKSIQKKMI